MLAKTVAIFSVLLFSVVLCFVCIAGVILR